MLRTPEYTFDELSETEAKVKPLAQTIDVASQVEAFARLVHDTENNVGAQERSHSTESNTTSWPRIIKENLVTLAIKPEGGISAQEFANLPTDKQIDYINNHHLLYLLDVLSDEAELSGSTRAALNEKFLHNADLVTHILTTSSDMVDENARKIFWSYLDQQPELLQAWPTMNLGSFLGVDELEPTSGILNEIKNRDKKAGDLLSFQPAKTGEKGRYQRTDTQAVVHDIFANLPQKTLNVVDELVNNFSNYYNRQVQSFLPAESEVLGLNPQSQLHLTAVIRGKHFSSASLQIFKEILSFGGESVHSFDYRLLDDRIVTALSKDFVLSIGIYPDISNSVMMLYKNQPQIFETFASLVRFYQHDKSLGAMYRKCWQALNFLLNNEEQFANINTSQLDLGILDDYIASVSGNLMRPGQYTEYDWQNEYKTHLLKTIDVDLTDNFRQELIPQLDRMKAELRQQYRQLKENGETDDSYSVRQLCKQLRDCYWRKFFDGHWGALMEFVESFGLSSHGIEHDLITNKNNDEAMRLAVISDFYQRVQAMNFEDLCQLYDTQSFRITEKEINQLEIVARQAYGQTFTKKMEQMSNLLEQNIPKAKKETVVNSHNSEKQVAVIDISDGEWGMFVYSNDTGYENEDRKRDFSAGYDAVWQNIDSLMHHGIATSWSSNENVHFANLQGDGVIYGFTNVQPQDIEMMNSRNIYSNHSDYGLTSERSSRFMSADAMSAKAFMNLENSPQSEVVLRRLGLKPSCILILDEFGSHNRECALKAAADWDIPVVHIHEKELAINQTQRVYEHFDRFYQNFDASEIYHALRLYTMAADGIYHQEKNELLPTFDDLTWQVNEQLTQLAIAKLTKQQKADVVKELNQLIDDAYYNERGLQGIMGGAPDSPAYLHLLGQLPLLYQKLFEQTSDLIVSSDYGFSLPAYGTIRLCQWLIDNDSTGKSLEIVGKFNEVLGDTFASQCCESLANIFGVDSDDKESLMSFLQPMSEGSSPIATQMYSLLAFLQKDRVYVAKEDNWDELWIGDFSNASNKLFEPLLTQVIKQNYSNKDFRWSDLERSLKNNFTAIIKDVQSQIGRNKFIRGLNDNGLKTLFTDEQIFELVDARIIDKQRLLELVDVDIYQNLCRLLERETNPDLLLSKVNAWTTEKVEVLLQYGINGELLKKILQDIDAANAGKKVTDDGWEYYDASTHYWDENKDKIEAYLLSRAA